MRAPHQGNIGMSALVTLDEQKQKPHQGNIGMSELDGGLRAMTLDEQKQKRKRNGRCPTCGEVQTHIAGLWKKWLLMPQTESGLIYKGICLACNTLDAAKLQLCEPIDGPDDPAGMGMFAIRGTIHQESGIPQQRPIHQEAVIPQNAMVATTVAKAGPAIQQATTKVVQRSNTERHHSSWTSQRTNHQDAVISQNAMGAIVARRASLTDNYKTPTEQHRSNVSLNVRVATTVARVDQWNSSRTPTDRSVQSSIITDQSPQDSGVILRERSEVSIRTTSSTKKSIITTSTKKKVNEFRCSDSDGESGFYTGTINQDALPHGRGEMVYDNGLIAKGVWSNGILKVKVAPHCERYEPYQLPGYSIGDKSRKEDMASLTREDTIAAVSKLHVNDCAWIRRSDGTWSYAIVKARSDGEDASIAFQVNPRGSTKKISIKQWGGGHVCLPARPDVHPCYSVGDPGRDGDICSQKETEKSALKLRIGDGGFVKRSDGSWVYGIVKDRTVGNDATVTFQVNARGSTKVIALSQCGKYVRRIKHNDGGHGGISDEKAKTIFEAIR